MRRIKWSLSASGPSARSFNHIVELLELLFSISLPPPPHFSSLVSNSFLYTHKEKNINVNCVIIFWARNYYYTLKSSNSFVEQISFFIGASPIIPDAFPKKTRKISFELMTTFDLIRGEGGGTPQ
jgi:hypothetical protein